MIEGRKREREEEREAPYALMKFLACIPTLADILFLVHAMAKRTREIWRASLSLPARPTPHLGPSEQKEYLYHLL